MTEEAPTQVKTLMTMALMMTALTVEILTEEISRHAMT